MTGRAYVPGAQVDGREFVKTKARAAETPTKQRGVCAVFGFGERTSTSARLPRERPNGTERVLWSLEGHGHETEAVIRCLIHHHTAKIFLGGSEDEMDRVRGSFSRLPSSRR